MQQLNTDIEAGDTIAYTGVDGYGYTIHLTGGVENGKATGIVVGTGTPHLPSGKGVTFTPAADKVRVLTAAEVVARRLEVNKRNRGHRFYPTKPELKKFPSLYANEELQDAGAATVVAHYFTPRADSDWWVTEYGKGDDLGLIFGYARINGDAQNAEWGYTSLVELESLTTDLGRYRFPIVERDCFWSPGPAREVIPGYDR